MHYGIGLNMVLQQPLTAGMAKTKADIAKKSTYSYSSPCTHGTVKGATCLDDGSFTLSVLLAMQVLYSRLCWPLCKNTYADVLNLSDSLSTQ